MTLMNTHELVLRTIAEGCGHETYRVLGAHAGLAPSTVLRIAQELEHKGRLVRCSCGHGWLAVPLAEQLHRFESQPSSG